jgi:serine/threonine-protein kinase
VTPEQWKRAKLVLEGARRHSPADRSQYVSVACADDPELLKEVESLLNLGSTPATNRQSETGTPALTAWEHLTVLAEVGRGAFGRVYRAWDPALQREVALKLIKVDSREPDFADSVFHEARLLVKVRHPNVVLVHGARRVGGEVGIWMEFISGPTLADAVERDGPMSAGEAAAAGIAICDALAAVHGAGLLHRDIKARNVMRDPGGRIVLMDFGAGAERARLPQGEIAGTPLYMAPELLKGAGASAASDIYSVGVLLFHLATGDYPVTGSSIYELEAAHERGTRVRLGDRRPDLPPSFVDAVERALSPDPTARFRRAVEFKEALADATARITGPVHVSAPPAGAQRPWMIGLAIAGALIALTFFGFVTSAAFNLTLGRERFADESAVEWPIWGVRALLAPAVYMGMMFLAAVLARWILVGAAAVLRRLLPAPARRAHAAVIERLRTVNPNTIVRLVAIAGVAALVGIWWQFWDLINSIFAYVDTAGPGAHAPLAPANEVERFLYRRSLELTMLVVGLGLYRAFRVRRESGARLDTAAVASALGALAIALLMTVIPYRIAWQGNQFPRARLDGLRCYVIGQDAGTLLVYCPDSPVPHNRTVPRDDKRLRVEGFAESIFTPPGQAAPAQP